MVAMSLTPSKKDREITKILTKTFDEFRNGSTTASMRLWPELVAEQFPESPPLEDHLARYGESGAIEALPVKLTREESHDECR